MSTPQKETMNSQVTIVAHTYDSRRLHHIQQSHSNSPFLVLISTSTKQGSLMRTKPNDRGAEVHMELYPAVVCTESETVKFVRQHTEPKQHKLRRVRQKNSRTRLLQNNDVPRRHCRCATSFASCDDRGSTSPCIERATSVVLAGSTRSQQSTNNSNEDPVPRGNTHPQTYLGIISIGRHPRACAAVGLCTHSQNRQHIHHTSMGYVQGVMLCCCIKPKSPINCVFTCPAYCCIKLHGPKALFD